MPRVRVPLTRKLEGKQWVVRFNHPLTRKTVRLGLADESEVKTADYRLGKLNDIFLNPDSWHRPPDGTPQDIIDLWNGDGGAKLDPPTIDWLMGILAEAVGPTRAAEAFQEIRHQLTAPFVKEISDLKSQLTLLKKERDHWRGRKIHDGPVPTLEKAFTDWKENKFKGKDRGYTKTVNGWLQHFVDHFKPETRADKLSEADVDNYIATLTNRKKNSPSFGQPLGASAKATTRLFILKMFKVSAGVELNRQEIARPAAPPPREIDWLTQAEAVSIAEKLPPFWADLFRFQVATGLRADELITLKRGDFKNEYATLTLSPRICSIKPRDGAAPKVFTIKNAKSAATVKVPAEVRSIAERRLKDSEIMFPRPDGDDWETVEWYNRSYNAALEAAAKAAGFTRFTLDCRTGRRTCGSLLLRSGLTYEAVAAVLRDRVETVKRHYASLRSDEIDLSAAALPTEAPKPKRPKAKKTRAKHT